MYLDTDEPVSRRWSPKEEKVPETEIQTEKTDFGPHASGLDVEGGRLGWASVGYLLDRYTPQGGKPKWEFCWYLGKLF